MLSTDNPSQFPIPWANSGTKNTIPEASQIGITAGAASLTDGFPPLTFTPVAAGGVPPSGADFNGILNELTDSVRWTQAGGAYVYDSAFVTAIGGYPSGARVWRSDYAGYWVSTVDDNKNDPESVVTGWTPSGTVGSASVTMTSSSVTLSNLEAGFDVITLTGTLTADLNLIVPVYKKQWTIVNNCSGAYSVTVKTALGTGVAIAAGTSGVVVGDGVNVLSTASGFVSLSGNQTIAGVKTFSSSPIVPNPVNETDAANKGYVDGKTILGTAVTASGAYVDFTGIPSWAKKIYVMLAGVSTNGTSLIQVQLGDSGGFENTGYLCAAIGYGSSSTTANITSGFAIGEVNGATNIFSGTAEIIKVTGNTYAATGMFRRNETTGATTQGDKTLSGTLDRIRITTVNGTDVFDSGTINILVEG